MNESNTTLDLEKIRSTSSSASIHSKNNLIEHTDWVKELNSNTVSGIQIKSDKPNQKLVLPIKVTKKLDLWKLVYRHC